MLLLLGFEPLTSWLTFQHTEPNLTLLLPDDHFRNDDTVKTGERQSQSGTRKKSDHRLSRQRIKNEMLDPHTDHKKLDHDAQAQLDYIGDNLIVRYKIRGNEGGRFFVDLTLTNNGSGSIDTCCWAIYFYHTKFLDIYSFNAGIRIRMLEEGRDKNDEITFTLAHVNGYTFRLQPTNRFTGLESGEKVVLRLGAGGWAVSRSEVIPNWYVANDYAPSEARLLRSTVGEELKFVGDFDPRKRWSRTEDDLCEPFTPEDRFSRNKVRDLEGAYTSPVLPTPVSAQYKGDDRKLTLKGSEWVVQYVEGLENEARFIQGEYLTKEAAD